MFDFKEVPVEMDCKAIKEELPPDAVDDFIEVNTKNLENLNALDINVKMKVVKNIVEACKTESELMSLIEIKEYCQKRVKSYTKADDYLVYKSKVVKPLSLSFDEWLAENKVDLVKDSCDELRELHLDILLNKRKIPTSHMFTEPHHKFRLKQCGYIHAKIPNTNFNMIIENTLQVRRRMEYLSSIIRFRAEGKNIVYFVETFCGVNQNDDSYSLEHRIDKKNPQWYIRMAACSKGLINCFFFKEFIKDYYETSIEDLLLSFTKPSVIVMEERSHHEKSKIPFPTCYSTKKEIINFLSKNNIPHDSEMSKGELYELSLRVKRHCRIEYGALHDKVRAGGHFLLMRPWGSEKLNFMSLFFKNIDFFATGDQGSHTFVGLKQTILNTLKNLSDEDWLKFEEDLIEREQQMYVEDLQTEEVIDRLMMMARNEKLNLKDFKQELDSDIPSKYNLNPNEVLIL